MQAEPPRYLVIVLCLIATTGQFGSFLYLPALPMLTAEFGTTEAGAQLTLTFYLLGTCLGFAFYGQIADAVGHRRVFWMAGVLFVLASIAGALVQGLASLNAVRFFQGVGSVAGIITARSSIRTLVPPARAPQAMAALTAVMGLAPAASPFLGALVLEVTGWRATFWLVAGMGVAMIAAGWAVLPRGVRVASQDRPRYAVRSLLRSPTFLACVLIGSTCNSAFMILMAGSPFVFIGIYGLSELAYTGLLAAMLVAFAGAALVSGQLVARLGARRVLGWAVVPVACGALGLAAVALLAPGFWPFYIVLSLLIGSMGLVVPTGHTIMLAPFPEIAGTAVGVAMLVNTIAGALALVAYGLVAAGSVTGFALSVAMFTFLIMAGWASLPRAGRMLA